MGNKELKQIFDGAAVGGAEAIPGLQQEVLQEEKIVDQMYATVVNKMLGGGDKIKLDLVFPDSNVQINDSSEEIFKSQTIQQISENLLSGFTPALGLVQQFNQRSEDELFTAISPLMVGDYTKLQKKKLVILYALFIEKSHLGSEKKISFFEYLKGFLANETSKIDISSQRLYVGLQGGMKFVINLLKEIRELSKMKQQGFPESILINSLEYMYQAMKETPKGSLYNTDHLSFMIDQNINEARSFLNQIVQDSSSPQRAIELASKIIFQFSLARTNVEDILVTASILDRDLQIDLRSDFEAILLASSDAKSDKKGKVVLSTEPLNSDEFKERNIIKTFNIQDFSIGGKKFESINQFTSFTTDGEHMYAHDSSVGIIKFSIKEDDFGKILVLSPNFKYSSISMVFIDGKLFVRDQLQRTRDSQKKEVSYLLLDPATLQVINSNGQLEPMSQNSDNEGTCSEEEEEETGPAKGELFHSLNFTKPSNNPVPKAGRYRIYTPLFTDSVFLYILTMDQPEHDESKSQPVHDSYGSEDEDMVQKPSVYIEQYEVKEEGRQLEFVKETLLLKHDGSSPLTIGHLDNVSEFLSECSLHVNGQALLMNLNYQNKFLIFDIQSGKLILEQENTSEYENMEMCFNPYTGQFCGLKEDYNEEIDEHTFKGVNFTISGFRKPVFESVKDSNFLENRITKFQKEIFAKGEKAKKDDREPSEFNIIEKLMFNVQTSDLIEESKASQGYLNNVDANVRQQMKSMLLYTTYAATSKLQREIEASKGNDSKMISVFKYPNVTFLTAQVFEHLKNQLVLSINCIKAKKTVSNIALYYNFFYTLNLTMANLQALNHCRLGLKDILRNEATYQEFLDSYQKTIVALIEEGYSQDFEGEEEDVKEMKQLWDQIYKLCLKILQSSLKLIYSNNQEILKYLDSSLETALTDFKKAESSILLLTYFSQQENLKKILGQGDEASTELIHIVYDKCRDLILHDIHAKIDHHFKKSKEEKKVEQMVKDLIVAANKFYVLLSEEIISSYCEWVDKGEADKYEFKEQADRKNFAEAEMFFSSLFKKGADKTAELIDKINVEMADYLDNKINPEDEKAKEKFKEISEALANLLNSEQGLFSILQSATQALSLFSLRTSLLPQIGASIVKVMDSFNKFNRDIHSKRKDMVLSVAHVKEILSLAALSDDSLDFPIASSFDPEEFKKLTIEQQISKGNQKEWMQLQLNDPTQKISHHQCILVKNPTNARYSGWGCDGRHVRNINCQGRSTHRWHCANHSYDICESCIKTIVYCDRICQGEFAKKMKGDDSSKIFEIDYKLKNFLDSFSRGLSWVLGQTAYKLIVIKKTQKKEGADSNDSIDEMQQMMIDSHLMSGGVEYRLVGQVFNKETVQVINDLSTVIGEKPISFSNEKNVSEDDKLIEAIINQGQNEHVDRLITALQSSFETKRPPVMWAKLNGAEGLRLTRSAFGCLIKFSDQQDIFSQLVDEVDMQSSTEDSQLVDGPSSTKQLYESIKQFPGFDGIIKCWESASKMRTWINDHKKELRESLEAKFKKEHSDKSEAEQEALVDKEYEQAMQEMFNSVVKRAQFLIKLRVPEMFLAKDQTQEKETLNFIKDSMVKAMSLNKNQEQQTELKDKMKTWRAKANIGAKSYNDKKKDAFETAVTSILSYLQAPVDLAKVQEKVEGCFLLAKKRATGLKMLSQLLCFEHIPKSLRYDLMMWFSCALRANKNEVTHYLDDLKGCGPYLEDQIRLSFFGIIKGLLGQLQAHPDETDVKVILNSLRWKYLAKDHSALKHLELFRTLYEGGWLKHQENEQENLIEKSWGKSIDLIVQSSEEGKSMTEMIISLFENIFFSVIGRLIKKEEQPKLKTKTPLSMERATSVIDENATESLLLQGFDIIFRELQKYIHFAQNYQGIDFNTYLAVIESPENKPWDQNLKKSESRGPVNSHATAFNDLDNMKSLKSKSTIPFMKQFRAQTQGDYIYGVEVIYRGDENSSVTATAHTGRSSSYQNWETFDFEEGEFITTMSVRTGCWMDRVAFTTNKGRSFQAGGGGGDFQQIGLNAPKGQQCRVVAIGGTHYDHMESLYCHYALIDKENTKDKSDQGSCNQSRAGSIIRSRSGSHDTKSAHQSGEENDDEESKGSLIDETPSAFNEDKLQKITGDTDIPLDLHPEEEIKAADVDISVAKEKIFTKEEETQMLDERKQRQAEEFKKLNQLYSEGFLKRILRLLETYTSLASTSLITYLQPLQRPSVIKDLLNIFLLTNPRIQLLILKILSNLIRINFPFELFEESISLLQKENKSCLVQAVFNNNFELKGSKFIRFLYSYLIEVRSKIYHEIGVENEGTYAVTSEIVRFLRFVAENCPQEEFRRAIRNKMSTFLSQSVDLWSIDEADIILSMFNGGSFTSLMTGSHALYKEQQQCVILGFSPLDIADSDLKVLSKQKINEFTSSIYCTDPQKEKALVLFISNEADESSFVTEVRAVELHNLNPIHTVISNTQEASLLYSKDVLVNLLKILSIESDDQTSLVVRQSQIQIIKILTTIIDAEFQQSGKTHSGFLKFLQDEGLIGELFGYLQTNAKKPQLFNKSDLNLPIEMLELQLTQIRIKAQEQQICLFKPSKSIASFSQFDNTIMIYKEGESVKNKEKEGSFLVTAEIVASFNEASLYEQQLQVPHQITLFSQVKVNPNLLTNMNFDLLFVDSTDLLTPASEFVSTLLSKALLNTNILIIDDQFDALLIYEALSGLESQIPQELKLMPLEHKCVFLIDRESFLEVNSSETTTKAVSVQNFEQNIDSFNQFMCDLKEWGGYSEEMITKIKARDGSKESGIKEIQKLWDQVQVGGTAAKLNEQEVKQSMDIKKLLVGNAAGLLRKQNSVKDNQPVVIEDVGLKIWKDLIEEPAREIEDVINTQMKKLKDAIKIDSSAEVKKEKLGILSKIIAGTNSNAADSQIYQNYVLILNKLLRLRSRTALTNFLHQINPLPKSLLNSFDSVEKLILISFNEAMNIKLLTGSKTFLKQVLDYIDRIFTDESMKTFANDFLNNFLVKPSVQVLKKIVTDKDFMKREVFQSEIDASMYPLPSLVYYLTKSLISKNLGVYKSIRGLLSNTVTILIGHAIAQTIKDPSQVTIQCKYLELAIKLLTTVRASITSGKEEGLDWADHVEDIARNQLLTKINAEIAKIRGAKKHEQQRLLREIMFEWYSIREYYTEEMKKGQPPVFHDEQEINLKFLKKLNYLNKRDPLSLFQISLNSKHKSPHMEQISNLMNEKIKKEIRSHPSNIVAPFLTKVKRIEHSEIIDLECGEFTGGLSNDILFFNDKGSDQEFRDVIPQFLDSIYLHYTNSLENKFSYCGWSKQNRLPNGIQSSDTYNTFKNMEGTWDIKQISSCNNATIMIDKDMKVRVVLSGSLKGGRDQGSEDHQQVAFQSPLKLVTAGKMSVALVLENDEIIISGHNKDSHFDQTETEQDHWYRLKLPAKDFKSGEDSIVDICQGTHFTLVVTKSGKLFGTGKQFMQTIGVNQEEPGKFTKIVIADDLLVQKVWCSRGKLSYMAVIQVQNTTSQEVYLMSAGQNFDGLLGQGNEEPVSATFKKLDYDHNAIKFTKVSMLTKHALALTSNGELYGWGSNENYRLGLDGVPNATKPTPIARFNDKSIFQLMDAEAGDDHSFVHLMETFKDTGMVRQRTYQIGFSEEQEHIEHRGGVTKKQLLEGGGIAVVTILDDIKVIKMCCGTQTSFFQLGEEMIPLKGGSVSISTLPGTWADYKLKHELLPNSALVKRGFLHLFKASQTQNKSILLDDRLYGEDTFPANNSRIDIKYEGDQASGPYEISGAVDEIKLQRFKVARGEVAEEQDIIRKGWLFYSQSEINQLKDKPQVMLSLRHTIPGIAEKLDVLEEYLKKGLALITEESKTQDELHVGIQCSETGQDIKGARYYSSYLNHNNTLVEINLSEDAFSAPTQFDHLPLPYLRFASPLPADAKMPEPVDLTKLHSTETPSSFDITVKTSGLFYNNKKMIIDLYNEAVEGSDPTKKMFVSFLKNGNKYEKTVSQFIQENKAVPEIDQFAQFLVDQKKDIIKYVKGDKSAGEFNSGQKKLLNNLAKLIKEENYTEMQCAFEEAKMFQKVAFNVYRTLSDRHLRLCHPESLPFLRRRLLQSFTFTMRNEMIQEQIGKLPTGNSQHEISIKRRKAFLFAETGQCDHEGTHTIFGQIYQEMKKNPSSFDCFKQNDTDTRCLRIEFKGEGSIDAGGPYRDAVANLCKELMSNILPLLIPTPNNKNNHGQYRECWIVNPSSTSPTHLELFKFFGIFLGHAIRSQQALPLDLAPLFWKLLLKETGEGVQSQAENQLDLKGIDTFSYKVIDDMRMNTKALSEDDFQYAVDEYFVTLLSNGKEVELCPGGKQRKVTKANMEEYISLIINVRLNESEKQMRAIREGVNFIMPLSSCNMLNWQMIEARATGSKTIDVEKLKAITQYNSCNDQEEFIKTFWQVIESFSDEERSMYLKFVWGRARLPATTDQKHQITAMQFNPNSCLPVSHTCFFTLDLPRYPSYELAREKILFAIQFCGDIDADRSGSDIADD